jgi:curli biogenesis system outer membrane secretion channel CsgG|tara:strand:+ start:335 stop:1222 length:888 start_codon:yes stop_codon:yes gene_type:complete
MFKKILFTLIVFSQSLVNAQSGKTSIALLDFTKATGVYSDQVTTIQEATTQGFIKAKRFILVDRSKVDAINRERDLQKSEEFIMSDYTIEQRSAIGAQFFVQGNVTNWSETSKNVKFENSQGEVKYSMSYEANLSVSIRVIDVSTSVAGAATTITGSSSSGGFFLGMAQKGSAKTALNGALQNLTKEVDKWIGKEFPAQFAIVEITKSNDSKGAMEVLIAGGSGTGLVKGEKLIVMYETIINVGGVDKKRIQEVGKLKIKDLDGEDFSICKVVNGGPGIQQKVSANDKVYAQTIK